MDKEELENIEITKKQDRFVIESLNKWFKESSKGKIRFSNSSNDDKRHNG